ncbi:hypothetical protein THASP1DRAFT_32728 [Thamnocephalis sphaerospora]|uniref:PCI domain-containing protein n=1 Tax=Thamnocephalis sphaerospora TaxID=78915 RepID=A0A4P9XIC2_9FUNG|nr:hypothetical protein THASP1DRAFT_32728 [Thamnocephalis sphaerospora]|eukprot:RKP05436.1 hypothetical protein THASP1DRAFT_32728 [Thamnocephalis sphaerospora]
MAVESANLALSACPRAERVTYGYYHGRYLLNQHRVVEAADVLQEAFFRCCRGARGNKRRILIFLTIASIMTDSAPTMALLQKYQLEAQFGGLIREQRRGHLAGYFCELSAYSSWHAHLGTLLLLHQYGMRMVYRNLFRRVYVLLGLPTAEKPRLRLVDLVAACHVSAGGVVEPDHDVDEVISLLAH